MLFFSRKNAYAEDQRNEPTEEQVREERKFAERVGPPRTATGETTTVVNMARAALDSAVTRSKAVQDSAKTLKAQTAKALSAYKK